MPNVAALHSGERIHQRSYDQMLEGETNAAYELSEEMITADQSVLSQ